MMTATTKRKHRGAEEAGERSDNARRRWRGPVTDERMRALIAAGGTGGHIYPGIAVAGEIMRRDPASIVRFVGTAHGLESRLVPETGFELSIIESAGLKNVSLAAKLRGLILLPRSFLAARRVIREFRPGIVIGAGGYVSGPVLLAAALMGLPTLVMDSNALPGWTNRVLARFVDKAAVSFREALPYFRGKGVLTGNPVRKEFFEIPLKQRDSSRFSLLVFGGSQGARAINEAMIAALPQLASLKQSLRITHQTGQGEYEKVRAGYEAASWSDNADVKPYIDNMVSEFANADLIVCRAGATTSAELVAAGRAARAGRRPRPTGRGPRRGSIRRAGRGRASRGSYLAWAAGGATGRRPRGATRSGPPGVE